MRDKVPPSGAENEQGNSESRKLALIGIVLSAINIVLKIVEILKGK